MQLLLLYYIGIVTQTATTFVDHGQRWNQQYY